MALIPCPECGKAVSDQAITCPHCGIKLGLTPIEAGLVEYAREVRRAEEAKGCAESVKGLGCLIVLAFVAWLGWNFYQGWKSARAPAAVPAAAPRAVPF